MKQSHHKCKPFLATDRPIDEIEWLKKVVDSIRSSKRIQNGERRKKIRGTQSGNLI